MPDRAGGGESLSRRHRTSEGYFRTSDRILQEIHII